MMLLQISDNIAQFFPSILKFGITGLSAIVFLLAYSLLRQQSRRQSPNRNMLNTIKSFMWIALVFAMVSGISSFAEGYFINKSINNDEKNNIRKEALIDIATNAISNAIEEVYSRHKYENGTISKGTVSKGTRDIETGELHKEMSERDIETGGLHEEMSEEDFVYKILRQAVFQTVGFWSADKEILQESLEKLERRGEDLGKAKSKILSNIDDLLALRYQWLQRIAIPNATKQIESFPPMKQEEPNAEIPLPKDVWIFSKYDADNQPRITVDFQELIRYKSELELIKQKL